MATNYHLRGGNSELLRQWLRQTQLEKTTQAMGRRGLRAQWVEDRGQALRIALEMIPKDATVGVGGSVTVREIGLLASLEERGTQVVHHWKESLTRDQDLALRREQLLCDYYVCSSNAITADGRLVNLDGFGNRLAGMFFGPPRVLVIAGVNKIEPDLDSAIWRARNVAAAMSTKSLNRKTPCATMGACNDCSSPERACRILSVIEFAPLATELSVLLIDEELGY